MRDKSVSRRWFYAAVLAASGAAWVLCAPPRLEAANLQGPEPTAYASHGNGHGKPNGGGKKEERYHGGKHNLREEYREWEKRRHKWMEERRHWQRDRKNWDGRKSAWQSNRNRWMEERRHWQESKNRWDDYDKRHKFDTRSPGWKQHENERRRWAEEERKWQNDERRWNDEHRRWGGEERRWNSGERRWNEEERRWREEERRWKGMI
ncbi:MAG: hypothetical protein LBU26_06640 [Synergistaceae bacterium]|nr:hypothetical protein [Synergistaceae bacterium]